MIAAEQGEEAGLSARRALGAAETQRCQAMLELVQIEQEIVTPQAGPLADRRQLRRLEVRPTERRQIAMSPGKAGQSVDDGYEPIAQQAQAFAQQYQIGIVGDEATGRSQVQNATGFGTDLAIGMDVGHHVVPQAGLVMVGPSEIDVVDLVPQLGELLRADARVRCRPRSGGRVPSGLRRGRPRGGARC